MSQDFSDSGIGFISDSELDCRFLRITIVEDKTSSVAVIRHNRLFDRESGKHFYGVEYIPEDACHERYGS